MLERAGLVVSRKVHGGGAGRPKTVYDVNRSIHYDLSFPKRQYFVMSKHLLEVIIDEYGKDEARRLMSIVGRRTAEGLLGYFSTKSGEAEISLDEFAVLLESLLNEFGCIASVELIPPDSLRVRLHNCIYYELAKLYPDVVCEGHMSLFNTLSKILGDYEAVQETCMAKGDRVCSTLLRRRGVGGG